MKKTDKNCRYLNLYPEDFVNSDIWKQICDSTGSDYDATEITVFYDADKTINNPEDSENDIVTKDEKSKLNSIADFILYQNYPKSSNGIYAYSEAYDIDYDINPDDEDGDDVEIIMFQVKFGQQDDCHNTTHSVERRVRRDVLAKWDGIGLPRLED